MSNELVPIKKTLTGDYFRKQVALCLPKHMTPDRFVRVALTALTRVPKLAQCTEASLIKCMLTCSELGLEPDGRLAHLIPYGKECTLVIDYKGLAELAMRSGKIAKLHADLICENDDFAYDLGEILHHRIDWRNPRGEAYAAYALAETNGAKFVQVMTRDEIEAIRKRSKAGNNGPWVTDWNEMAKKTVFRRLAKWLPLSPEMRDALDKAEPDSTTTHVDMLTTELTALPDQSTEVETVTEPEPAKQPENTPQEELQSALKSEGFGFDDFRAWASETGAVPDADSLAGFDDLSDADAKRMIRAKTGILKSLKENATAANK